MAAEGTFETEIQLKILNKVDLYLGLFLDHTILKYVAYTNATIKNCKGRYINILDLTLVCPTTENKLDIFFNWEKYP